MRKNCASLPPNTANSVLLYRKSKWEIRTLRKHGQLPNRHSAARAAARKENRSLFGLLALPLLMATLLVLSACASISEEECLAADWYSIGTEDGAKGYPLTRIGNYRKDCAEVGIAPDAEQYNQGRLVGLEQFCTYERGYSEGKRGASNRKVCPAGQLEADFTEGYMAGRYVYDINKQIRSLERELSQVRSEIAGIEAGIEGNYYIEEDGTKRDLTKLERQLLFDKLKHLNSEAAHLENEIGGLRASIAGS